MHRVLAAIAAVCLVGTAASAADLGGRMPVKAAPMVAAAYPTWAGFYLGGHVGYGWGSNDFSNALVGSVDSDGFIGGGQIGYNWQIQNWVLGIEGQFSGADISETATVVGGLGGTYNTDINWMASITGKVGYAVLPTALIYGKGGVAFADTDSTRSAAGLSSTVDKTRTGWTIGAGAEWAFAPQWSAMAEYQYYDFGSDTYNHGAVLGSVDLDTQVHTVKVGVNYHFGR